MTHPDFTLIPLLKDITSQFNLEGEIDSISPLEGGLINTNYLIKTQGESPDYVLQKKNKKVFKNIPEMMNNIVKVTSYLKTIAHEAKRDPRRVVLTIINTKAGLPYFKDEEGEYWTISEFIPDTITYENAKDLNLIRKGGEGIGNFLKSLADFNEPLYPTIEGFHNLSYRFSQWDKSVKKNLSGRAEKVKDEIVWIEKRRPAMTEFWSKVETGLLPMRVTHNDTKLSNMLFNRKGEVECVLDLDTVMSNTALADYGDAIRSFANSGKEDDLNLENVNLDKEKFRAYTYGYLSKAVEILTSEEIENLHMGPLYITFEQVMRFLMDYIDGDTYYKISYPDHNLVRTRAQIKLLESMEENIPFMQQTIKEINNI